MARLRYYSWWPNAWVDDASLAHTPIEIRKDAVLRNVRRAGEELTLVVDCNGLICTATIESNLSEDFLILLRHILLQHWGEPISAVEDLEVNFTDLA